MAERAQPSLMLMSICSTLLDMDHMALSDLRGHGREGGGRATGVRCAETGKLLANQRSSFRHQSLDTTSYSLMNM